MGDGLKRARAAGRATREGAFKVGDAVTVHDHYDGAVATRKIVSLSGRCAVDAAGYKWANEEGGREWGRARETNYMGQRIRRRRVGEPETVRAKSLRRKIALVTWADVSLDTLEAVAALLALDPAKVPA